MQAWCRSAGHPASGGQVYMGRGWACWVGGAGAGTRGTVDDGDERDAGSNRLYLYATSAVPPHRRHRPPLQATAPPLHRPAPAPPRTAPAAGTRHRTAPAPHRPCSVIYVGYRDFR